MLRFVSLFMSTLFIANAHGLAAEFQLKNFGFASPYGGLYNTSYNMPLSPNHGEFSCTAGGDNGKHEFLEFQGYVKLPAEMPATSGIWDSAHEGWTTLQKIRDMAPGWAEAFTTWVSVYGQDKDGHTVVSSQFEKEFMGNRLWSNWYLSNNNKEPIVKFLIHAAVIFTKAETAHDCSTILGQMFKLRDGSPE